MTTTAEKLKEKHAKELAELEQEEVILEKLPDVGHEWRIHLLKLYGTVAHIEISQPYGYSDEKPSLETALAVAIALPGLPMVKVKGTFTSYLAAAQLPHYEKKGRREVQEETPLAPWVIEGQGGPGARNGTAVELKWVTDVEGVGLVCVSFELPYVQQLRYSAHRIDFRGGHRWENERIDMDQDALYTIFNGKGDPAAELGTTTKWASGGPECPSRVTKGWTPLDDPATATTADFIRALIGAETPPEGEVIPEEWKQVTVKVQKA